MAQKKKNFKIPSDYDRYPLSFAQTLASIVVVGLIAAVIAYIFYMNIIIAAFAMLLGLLGPMLYRKQLINKRKKDLIVQFKDFLYSLNSSVSAGKNIKEGIINARDDLAVLYMSDNCILIRELDNMIVKMKMEAEVTTLMTSLGKRSGNEDIVSFATVLESGKNKGIKEVELIQKTVHVISEKIEIKNEIDTKVAAMKMDQLILLIMPILLTVLMNTMAPDYMQGLYDSPYGYLIITAALALIAASVLLSNKIMNIKV